MDPNANPEQTSASIDEMPAKPKPRFQVGHKVHNQTTGVGGEVFGVHATPDGEQLLFSPHGRWLSAEGFAIADEDPEPVPEEPEAPLGDPQA